MRSEYIEIITIQVNATYGTTLACLNVYSSFIYKHPKRNSGKHTGDHG